MVFININKTCIKKSGIINGTGIGQVVVLIKNTFYPGNYFEQQKVLLGDISQSDSSTNNGLSTLVSEIQSENARNPVKIIGDKISGNTQFLTDFVSSRITAIRGYFDEVFAHKIHTDEMCLKKSDGNEICVTGDQINSLLNNSGIAPTITQNQIQQVSNSILSNTTTTLVINNNSATDTISTSTVSTLDTSTSSDIVTPVVSTTTTDITTSLPFVITPSIETQTSIEIPNPTPDSTSSANQ